MVVEESKARLNSQWSVKGMDDLICLSHLRWDFVYQRPQHLMSRCAPDRRVFFIEEPVQTDDTPHLQVEAHTVSAENNATVWVVVPHIPAGIADEKRTPILKTLIDQFLLDHKINSFIAWYYTPEALTYTRHLQPKVTVYDCMDELKLFKGANPKLYELELELFRRADLVFTGGQSLYKAKYSQHDHIFCFPSSIDKRHFEQARRALPEPEDQKGIPHPRLGFFGVLDERLDIQLLADLATARPDWHLVLVGPVVKIDPNELPRNANIHYLGMKAYRELPHYLAGWDVALLPFAINDSTKFISPTKTPEYLAGGRPVVSTPITDVVHPYGEKGFVQIASNAKGFVEAIEQILDRGISESISSERDAFLSEMSWDNTWQNMELLIDAVSHKTEVNGKMTLKTP